MTTIPTMLRALANLLDGLKGERPTNHRAFVDDLICDAYESDCSNCSPGRRGFDFDAWEQHDHDTHAGRDADVSSGDDCECGCEGFDAFDDLVDTAEEEPRVKAFAWRRWYDAPRAARPDVMPTALVDAFLNDLREATMLHSIAVRALVRKWGLESE